MFRKSTADAPPLDHVFKAERDLREQAETSLRQSEEVFRLLVESVTEYAIFMLDPNGRVATWNLGAQRIKGYRADEVIGRHFSLFYPAAAVENGWPERELEAALAIGRFEDEGWRVRKDGSLFWANVIITATYDHGRLCGFSKVTRDLTERKRREEELLKSQDLLEERVQQRTAELTVSEARFRNLLFALPVPVYTTDRQGRITLYNDRAAELWGRRPEIGKESWCGSYRIFRPDGTLLPHDQCPMALTLCEGRLVKGQEIFVERPDGSRVCVLPHPELLRDAEGEIVGAVNMLVDISDRKRAEEELRERAEALKRLETELRQTVDELAAADRRKNEFLATLAHELRNPLAPLHHGLELLHLAAGDPEIFGQATGVMERQLGQMARLVDDLLDVSRIGSGKLQLNQERIELAAALQSAVEAARPRIAAAGHELTVSLPAEPVVLDADLNRLTQVFTNLLNNAAKYTEPGGRIWLAAERRGDEITVSVRDTGIGIAAAHLPHLFEIFSQVSPDLDRSAGGLGIGLSLVRGLVELHGGRVEARSDGPGQGSEFLVRLPIAEPATAPQPARAEREEQDGALDSCPRYRILVADDNKDTVDSLGMLLELSGHSVKMAYDGVQVIQEAAAFLPQVALLDIGMPKHDGYEAARQIRQQPWGKDMVLIAITGWGQDDDKRQALAAGFDHHLVKPVEPADLKRLLGSLTMPK